LRFLVIDDDELSRELLAVLLESEGYEVELAASGDDAIARLNAAGKPSLDVILSDIQMPGLSGASLARELRSAGGEDMTLLAMSGSEPAIASLTGFDGFLLKPFAMEQLEEALAGTRKRAEISAVTQAAGTGDGDPVSEPPALNEDIYAKLAKMMSAAQLGEMYTMCLTDARKRLAQMAQSAEAGDDEGYRKTAHTVKGGCGMIGATELYTLAETAERDGLGRISGSKSGVIVGINGVTTLLERLSYACERLERILGEHK
jgi:CheY-like chemotaxis protein